MADKKLALVQWCGGIDDRTYTSGIPLPWIRNFDYEVYCSDKSVSSEAYAVEWRDSKKPPKGGWKLYDAYVIHVSDRLSVLDDRMKRLEGKVSPYKEIPQNLQDSSESKGKDKDKGIGHRAGAKKLSLNQPKPSTPGTTGMKNRKAPSTTGAKRRHLIISSDDESVTAEEVSGIEVLQKSPEVKETHARSEESGAKSPNVNVDSNDEQGDFHSNHESHLHVIRNSGLEEEQYDSQREPASGENREFHGEKTNAEAKQAAAKKVTLESVLEAITSMSKKLTNIEALLTTGEAKTVVVAGGAKKHSPLSEPGTSGPASKNARFLEDGHFIEGNIEIGEVGSQVFVTDMQWAKATSTPTYTAMTVSLLLASFPLDTLLRSNYKGGASKVNKGDAEAGRARQALDERIIEAIKYSVRHQHPKDFKEAGFGQAINVKLSALRRLQKK